MFKVYEAMLPDHVGVLRTMTRPGGNVVLAAENRNMECTMIRAKQSLRATGWIKERDVGLHKIMRNKDENPVLRGGEAIDAAVRRHFSSINVHEVQQWRWNRVPPELHEGHVTNVHQVIGIALS